MLNLAETLAALPNTANGIAAHLRAAGITGVRQDESCCPIANWLTGLGFECPEVTENTTAVDGSDGQQDWVYSPDPLVEFIRRFDKGAYPELVSDPEATDA